MFRRSLLQVTMADREAAERAFANPNPVIEGRRANVNLAYIGAKPKMHCPPGIYMHGVSCICYKFCCIDRPVSSTLRDSYYKTSNELYYLGELFMPQH